MITSNALGHFIYSRSGKTILDDASKITALESAMRTIGNAYPGLPSHSKYCPATFLVPAPAGETSPLRETSDFRKFSADHYCGYFHTDHLVPSVFFHREKSLKNLKLYDDLTFRYIYDSEADPEEHAELTTGVNATWYEVKRNMDQLPDYADPEKSSTLPLPVRARLAKWLEHRLNERLGR